MALEQIQLNLINESSNARNNDVVIFQKNVAVSFDELSLAWQVIKNCGQGDNHPFTYSMEMEVGASDSWGNFTPKLTAFPGNSFEMLRDSSGDVLQLRTESAVDPTEVEVRNELGVGAMTSTIYRDGKPLASKSYAPKQEAVYKFKPTIWIGVVSQVTEGKVMNSAALSQVNTELNLLGVASADILWTGGGTGPTSTPFQFKLANVEMV